MSSEHGLSFTRSLLDPLHGLIRLTNEELRVIDDPLFQRMRSIRQNGLLHLVFPGALHNRFIHSIGAMHVAHEMLQAVLSNTEADADKLAPEGDVRPGEAVRIPPAVANPLFRISRLAMLVHDLGHGPFSHGFDPFAPRIGQIAKLITDDERLAMLREVREKLCSYDNVGATDDAPIAHEAMSCVLFACVWNKIGDPNDGVVKAVTAALIGVRFASYDGLEVLNNWMSVVSGMVSSSPIDADRMDYMIRDSAACGVTYGTFDRNRVLKSALCYRDGAQHRIGWKYSGLRALENFVQARFQLYAQVYYHKTNNAFSQMLAQMGKVAKEAKLNLFHDVTTLDALCDRYLQLSDDSRFLEQLRSNTGFGRSNAASKEVAAVAERIARRNPWKRVFEGKPGFSARAMLGVLKARGLAQSIFLDETPLKATKGLDKGASLLERRRKGYYCTVPAKHLERGWLDASPVLQTLHNAEREISRLYYTGTNPDELTEIRKWVQDTVGGDPHDPKPSLESTNEQPSTESTPTPSDLSNFTS